jgi:hypothetical protein
LVLLHIAEGRRVLVGILAERRDGKYGYIDKQGHFVVNPQFDEAGEFNDGLAAVRIGNDKTGKYGYIARY